MKETSQHARSRYCQTLKILWARPAANGVTIAARNMLLSLLLVPTLATAFVTPQHAQHASLFQLQMRSRSNTPDVEYSDVRSSWITQQVNEEDVPFVIRNASNRSGGGYRDFEYRGEERYGGPPYERGPRDGPPYYSDGRGGPPPFGVGVGAPMDSRPNSYRAPKFDGQGNPIFDGRDQFGRPVQGDRELFRQEGRNTARDQFGRPFSSVRDEGPNRGGGGDGMRDRFGRPLFSGGGRDSYARGDPREGGRGGEGARDQFGRPIFEGDRGRQGEGMRRDQQFGRDNTNRGRSEGQRETGRDQFGRPPQDVRRDQQTTRSSAGQPPPPPRQGEQRDSRSQMVSRDQPYGEDRRQEYGRNTQDRRQEYGRNTQDRTYTDKNISVRDMRLHFMVPSTIPGHVFHQMPPKERFDHDEILVVDGNVLRAKLPKFAYFAELTNDDIVEYLSRFYRY